MQSAHALRPLLPWNLPAGHSVHVPCPPVAEKLPGKQSMHALAALLPGTGLALPGSQARHELLLFAPRSGL